MRNFCGLWTKQPIFAFKIVEGIKAPPASPCATKCGSLCSVVALGGAVRVLDHCVPTSGILAAVWSRFWAILAHVEATFFKPRFTPSCRSICTTISLTRGFAVANKKAYACKAGFGRGARLPTTRRRQGLLRVLDKRICLVHLPWKVLAKGFKKSGRSRFSAKF